jgi:HlyD family secretion protein
VLIPQHYADEMGPGTPAVIDVGGRKHAGYLKSISPEVEGSQVRGLVAFGASEPEGLRQNQRVTARLILERKSGVLKVARGPFLDAGGGREAWVVEGDIAARRPIQAGVASVSEVEILSGLDEGDRIIVSDTARFEEAQRIYLRD